MFNNSIFNIIFTVLTIIVVCVFIFTFAMMFSPKLRAKYMGHQLKASKYVMDENEEILKELNTKGANITKDGIETTARAIKKGLTGDTIYCKHCGASIDTDSKFCKSCGKKQ